jgi:hypothetical protein
MCMHTIFEAKITLFPTHFLYFDLLIISKYAFIYISYHVFLSCVVVTLWVMFVVVLRLIVNYNYWHQIMFFPTHFLYFGLSVISYYSFIYIFHHVFLSCMVIVGLRVTDNYVQHTIFEAI